MTSRYRCFHCETIVPEGADHNCGRDQEFMSGDFARAPAISPIAYAFNELQPDAEAVIVHEGIAFPIASIERARRAARMVGCGGLWRLKSFKNLGESK